MKKNGFTLIELLAVIVILAIIAIIATPIVLNIINNSKESAQLRSAELYLGAVETAVVNEMMDDSAFKPSSCEIQNDGNINCDGKEVKIEIKGEKPSSGSITLKQGKVQEAEIVISEKIVIKEPNGDLVYKTKENNIVFDDKIVFEYVDTFGMDLITNIDASKIKDKSNYKVTLTKEGKESVSVEVMSIMTNIGGQSALFLGNAAVGSIACLNGSFCLPVLYGVEVEAGDNLKIEYLNDDVYPHVLRVGKSSMEIFSTELEEGTATLEFNDSTGSYDKIENFPVKIDGGFGLIYLPLANPYILLQKNGWFTVTVTQGEKTFILGSNNNGDFKYWDGADCNYSNYYYYGNQKIGYFGGC